MLFREVVARKSHFVNCEFMCSAILFFILLFNIPLYAK